MISQKMIVPLAEDSSQLTKILEKETVDVVLIDISVLKNDGLNTTRRISEIKTVSEEPKAIHNRVRPFYRSIK